MELGRPVSESQFLFTRNCWLRTGSFLLSLKKWLLVKKRYQLTVLLKDTDIVISCILEMISTKLEISIFWKNNM